jgi:hypothetical protein
LLDSRGWKAQTILMDDFMKKIKIVGLLSKINIKYLDYLIIII